MVRLPPALKDLFTEARTLSRAYLAGGCVRDALLGLPQKDFDIEVFGVGYAELAEDLGRFGRVDLVGKSFGVVKVTVGSGETYDFSLPRRDSKTGPGHKGFAIEFDSTISLEEAAARRDYTINSLMFDPRTGEVIDHFGGRADLELKLLRHTSAAFVDDPLRVLRGMQFAARFDLVAVPETVELCRQIRGSFAELPKERVREEWWKWATRSVRPSAGLRFLNDTGWIEHFPELAATRNVPQDPIWHPEGDVFTHTCHCCDAMVTLPEWRGSDEGSRAVYLLAVLTHDFGKAQCTHSEMREGVRRIVSPGHEVLSARLAETFLAQIDIPLEWRSRVPPLAANHMIPRMELSDRAIRRLSHRLLPDNIHGLCLVMTADASGRPPKPPGVPGMVSYLRQRAADLNVVESAPHAVLMGRHLVDIGMVPGRRMGELLQRAYEAQLEGVFGDLSGALKWLREAEADTLSPEILRRLTPG